MTDRERQRRFESLLREHQRIVFKVASVYAHDAHDRDDLAQEIALQAWRSFRAFDERRAKFSAWLYRVALNVAISSLRNAQRRAAGNAGPMDAARIETVVDGGVAPHAIMEHDERIAALHAFIAR